MKQPQASYYVCVNDRLIEVPLFINALSIIVPDIIGDKYHCHADTIFQFLVVIYASIHRIDSINDTIFTLYE